MKRRWLYAPLVVGTVILAAPALALAASNWTAAQNGSHQWGGGQATRLTIRVEAGGDPNSSLVPDGYNCPPTSLAGQYPGCAGGALVFSIQNETNTPLRVTGVLQSSYPNCNSNCVLPILSDKLESGIYFAGSPSGLAGGCGGDAYFAGPNLAGHPWPIIGPHSTLEVDGTDNNALGLGMLHLFPNTPSACQGASFYVPITVLAQDAS